MQRPSLKTLLKWDVYLCPNMKMAPGYTLDAFWWSKEGLVTQRSTVLNGMEIYEA